MLYKAYHDQTPKNINTLAELDTSGLEIITSSPLFQNIFGDDENDSELFKSLRSKLFLSNSGSLAIDQAVTSGDVCAIERLEDVYITIKVGYLFNRTLAQ